MRREDREGLVPPVIAEAWWTVLLVERKDRQQLDGAYPELPQIRDLLDQPGVCASLSRVHARTRMPGEPADMHLVDDRFGKGPPGRRISLPVIGARVDHHAL